MARQEWQVPVVLMCDTNNPIGMLNLTPEAWATFDVEANKLVLSPIIRDGSVVAVSLQPIAMTQEETK